MRPSCVCAWRRLPPLRVVAESPNCHRLDKSALASNGTSKRSLCTISEGGRTASNRWSAAGVAVARNSPTRAAGPTGPIRSGTSGWQRSRCSSCRPRPYPAHQRKRLADYPCKSGGVVAHISFAPAIDPRIRCDCISCPPDAHPAEWFWAWSSRSRVPHNALSHTLSQPLWWSPSRRNDARNRRAD